jgi:hypothetical protein
MSSIGVDVKMNKPASAEEKRGQSHGCVAPSHYGSTALLQRNFSVSVSVKWHGGRDLQ